MNTNQANIAWSKPVVLVGFTLFSAFSGAAMAGTVHKCLQANGLYEYSDKKCIAVAPATAKQQAVPVTDSPNGETKQTDSPNADANTQARETAPLSAPEAQPKQAPLSNGNTAPSTSLKNNLST